MGNSLIACKAKVKKILKYGKEKIVIIDNVLTQIESIEGEEEKEQVNNRTSLENDLVKKKNLYRINK